MEYTAANLEYAVSVFYNCESNERTQAHQWLTTAQRCPEAWSFVWELLQSHKGTEVQFFAATTLHTKLLRCWNEVPPENYEELKNKILEAILAFCNGPKIVLNRLCISLAAYIMQQGAADLVSTLRPLSGPESVLVLLDILTVIPEEFNSMTMGAVLRTRTRMALQLASPAVLDDMLRHLHTVYHLMKENNMWKCWQPGRNYLLGKCGLLFGKPTDTSPSEPTIQRWGKAASCAASWLALGGDVTAEGAPREVGTTTTNLHDCLPLCQALLHVVHTVHMNEQASGISESGLEACEAALGAVRAAAAAPDAARQPIAALQLCRMLADLAPPLFTADTYNEELLASLFTCAVAIGECHTRAIVAAMERDSEDADNAGRALVELLLECQAAPGHYPIHETRSTLTFGFWFMLLDEVTCGVESATAPSALMKQVFSRLLDILIEKSRAPDEASLSSDDAELLRCYRQDIADTVMYCWNVLDSRCVDAVEAAWERSDTDAGREAALHVFLALADAAPGQRAPPALTRMLERAAAAAAGATDTRLLHTGLECLGGYAAWLGSLEEGGGAVAAAALRAAGAALPRAPARAALALRKLCAECGTHAAPLAPEIVDAVKDGGGTRYEGWVRRQLLAAAGAALAAAPAHVAEPLLSTLADHLLAELHAEAEAANRLGAKAVSRGSCEAAAALLYSLLQRRELATALLHRLLPALPPLSRHPPLVPVLFLFLKHTLQVLLEECLPLAEQLSDLALQALRTQPCPDGIDVIRLMVFMLGAEWGGAAALLRACAETAVATCSAGELSASADVAEALFTALTAVAKKRPQYLDFLGEFLPQTVELGCACVRLWEAGAARSACGWLAALSAARPHVLRAHAPGLAAIAVRCIGGATPRNQVEPLADLLLALNRAPWSDADRAAAGDLAAWLRSALAPAGYPSPHATDRHKNNFIAAVVKEKSSRRRVLETVQEFSLVCRGLVGTEYARQTLASRQLVA